MGSKEGTPFMSDAEELDYEYEDDCSLPDNSLENLFTRKRVFNSAEWKRHNVINNQFKVWRITSSDREFYHIVKRFQARSKNESLEDALGSDKLLDFAIVVDNPAKSSK